MTHRPIWTALGGAALLGALGDLLLRTNTWGVNFTLWVLALASLAWVVLQLRAAPPRGVGLWLVVAVFFAFLGYAWRDSEFLRFWNFLAILAALSMAILRAAGVDLLVARIRVYVAILGRLGGSLAMGAGSLVLHDVPWGTLTSDRAWRRMGRHALGFGIAVPALFVFGGLFASADPVFESMATRLISWDLEPVVSHTMLAGAVAWLSAGYLRGFLRPKAITLPDLPAAGRLGFPEVGIPLATVVTLFSIFVAIQATYLFGGEEFVRRATGMGFADYARRGFFELVAASALVVPLLLVGHWALTKEDAVTVHRFRILAFALLLLVDLVAVSALWRMRLYTSVYGLTQDRLYAATFILWVGLLLGWFALTLRQDRTERFAFGAVVSGFALLAVLNLINPDALVARVNLARGDAGKELDVSYLSRLSADAAPTIAGSWVQLDSTERCALLHLVGYRSGRGAHDWRSWSFSRSRARRAVRRSGIDATYAANCNP